MDKHLSICITLKDRTAMMIDKIKELLTLDYNLKQVELCVTDGGDSEELREVLELSAKHFYQVKYAVSDRSALPFVIPENNPACDINAQVCNVATFEKIVRTDAEVRFRRKDSLSLVASELEKDKELCLCFRSFHMSANFKVNVDDPTSRENRLPINYPRAAQLSAAKMSFHCSCFMKSAFIKNGGVEEAFAKGFAAEDSYFHQWWRKNRHFKNAPAGYEVLHLWHGRWQSENRLRLKHNYTLPMYKQFLKENRIPNGDNPDWKRPEMIRDIKVWN